MALTVNSFFPLRKYLRNVWRGISLYLDSSTLYNNDENATSTIVNFECLGFFRLVAIDVCQLQV
jgi:hypothetical protein